MRYGLFFIPLMLFIGLSVWLQKNLTKTQPDSTDWSQFDGGAGSSGTLLLIGVTIILTLLILNQMS